MVRRTSILDAIAVLDKHVSNPSSGLPDEVFYYISRTTPLVNVDLLIKDEKGCTLLAWRDDQHTGRGWHVPGGIVRYKETIETRIEKVIESEIGTPVTLKPEPIAVNQLIHPERKIRGHFISFLYQCFLSSSFMPQNKGISLRENGYLMWHQHCPDDLIKVQEIYKRYIEMK